MRHYGLLRRSYLHSTPLPLLHRCSRFPYSPARGWRRRAVARACVVGVSLGGRFWYAFPAPAAAPAPYRIYCACRAGNPQTTKRNGNVERWAVRHLIHTYNGAELAARRRGRARRTGDMKDASDGQDGRRRAPWLLACAGAILLATWYLSWRLVGSAFLREQPA